MIIFGKLLIYDSPPRPTTPDLANKISPSLAKFFWACVQYIFISHIIFSFLNQTRKLSMICGWDCQRRDLYSACCCCFCIETQWNLIFLLTYKSPGCSFGRKIIFWNHSHRGNDSFGKLLERNNGRPISLTQGIPNIEHLT